MANSTGTVTGSVARAGSFRGPALIVGAGTDEALLAKQLRQVGIFVEGPIVRQVGIFVEGPIAAVTLMAREAEEKLAAENEERRQRTRHADKS